MKWQKMDVKGFCWVKNGEKMPGVLPVSSSKMLHATQVFDHEIILELNIHTKMKLEKIVSSKAYYS